MSAIPDRIFELIILKLNREQSPEEDHELEVWLSTNPSHRELWEDYQQLQQKLKLLDQDFMPDTGRALQNIKNHEYTPLKWRKVMRWAAVFALPLCVGLWLLWNSGWGEEHRTFSQIAHPGGGKAVLKLEGQGVITLEDRVDTLIVTENGIKIRTDSGNMMSYSVDKASGNVPDKENQLLVPRGGEYRITLNDGTRVWLNSASELTFPQVFSGDVRKVKVRGEAFFKVQPDPEHPFIVSTTNMDIKVLGTSFNVSAYGDEEFEHTTLVHGSVEIYTHTDQVFVLKPGEQACIEDGNISCREVNVRQFTSWIEGKFMFCNTPLEEIGKQISRWYDVDIFFSNEQLKSICFTGAILRFEPLEELIRMIEATSNVTFHVKGKTVVVSEK